MTVTDRIAIFAGLAAIAIGGAIELRRHLALRKRLADLLAWMKDRP